ncbi:MAG: phosphopentomutase [Polyangia bacterium]|nr:phosphopentomutase [Polyangia bacterium]
MSSNSASDSSPKHATQFDRAIVIVLDSVGIGALPDAPSYGDDGAATLPNVARAVGGLALPNLGALGLGNIVAVDGTPPSRSPRAAHGKLGSQSRGKDTTSGHWELMGLPVKESFSTWPEGFPGEILDVLRKETGREVLGNKTASGTEVLEELGPEQLRTGAWIVYTSADSVLQIAAHEEKIPLAELYAACALMRKVGDTHRIGRIIARPFVGEPGSFKRTYNRHDYSILPHGPTVLDNLTAAGVPVLGIGKIKDIFAGQGVPESVSTAGNADGIARTLEAMGSFDEGLVFVNLVDFDMLYGHRNDAAGYAKALRELDAEIPRIIQGARPSDLIIFTADHGNDPTHPGTDHTREYVPLLVFGPRVRPVDLGVRQTFADVGATVAAMFGVKPPGIGQSLLDLIG